MNTNQKVMRLLDQIINGRKGYCGDHFVYTPQLQEDVVNELRAELISESASQPPVEADAKERCPNCLKKLNKRTVFECSKCEYIRTA